VEVVMPKKSGEQKVATGEVARYQRLYDRVCKVSALEVGRLFATRDPRVQFIRSLEDGRVLSRVELNALTRLLTDHLGVDPEVWLRYLNEELEAELRRLEQDNGVSGYDEQGNPLLGGAKP
jgi:hypothetical protein